VDGQLGRLSQQKGHHHVRLHFRYVRYALATLTAIGFWILVN
jgi:hypothetical protein